MSDSLKHTFPDDNQVSGQFNRTDTSPELIAQLRSVGSRVRKSVTEGYKSPPTSRAFTKAQSTTTIFTSAKDINRDVFGSADTVSSPTGPVNPQKKRSRSVEGGSDTELDVVPALEKRVIKPLRKHRGMIETRSLPAEAFRFSHELVTGSTSTTTLMEVEEDWSERSADGESFAPVVLD